MGIKHAVFGLLGAALMLAGCDQNAPPANTKETVRPAQIMQVGAGSGDSSLRFPGRVRAVQRAELAFNVPGRIVELPVREGQRVEQGTLVARLDGENYQIRLNSAEAEYNKARTDYNRVNRIWQQSQAVARAEVDQKRTAMEVARAGYLAAKKDMDDTRLLAPFDGVITRRQVENFSNVQAKQPVLSLQDTQNLEIVISVPERVVRTAPRQVEGLAVFADRPEQPLPVRLKSFSAEADPQTQSYEAVLALTAEPGFILLPGMSVEIMPNAMEQDPAGPVTIPLRAVVAGPDGSTSVWKVTPESERVERQPVTLGPIQGDNVVVNAGLNVGERIVTAGVSQLREGTRVRPMPSTP
ncbi:efflux RND transporter periplasmic adaptor subunit [Oceanimonas sp. CHS3-5]|uniref:efflux RND transporter periplasmic adaptor subunit n=1 Tax=Oceanimonas sp. CHS3-5 TaxID=3068186 RepID=UPI00273EB9D1|nr:efflux RND transporter periplasmic adaptor subunit [Oceanimonas sp. CHS3-5]MDP5292464.1 efflux RND transporter periplasmic adaptor subunit [Oceanimonas sp. CHS3-5]